MYTAKLNDRHLATFPIHLTWEQVVRCVERYAFRRMRRGQLSSFTIVIRGTNGEHTEVTDKPSEPSPERFGGDER
jgi:hypothetical protein